MNVDTDSRNNTEQGLLDLAVELSTHDTTAGNEFAIFVLVKNPFSRPVWIREVNVSLPSELKRIDEEIYQKTLDETKKRQQILLEEAKKERLKLQETVNSLKLQTEELITQLKNNNTGAHPQLTSAVNRLDNEILRPLCVNNNWIGSKENEHLSYVFLC